MISKNFTFQNRNWIDWLYMVVGLLMFIGTIYSLQLNWTHVIFPIILIVLSLLLIWLAGTPHKDNKKYLDNEDVLDAELLD